MLSRPAASVPRCLEVEVIRWPLKDPFRTADGSIDVIDTIQVRLRQHGVIGRGEAAGVYWRGESIRSMLDDIERIRPVVEQGLGRAALTEALPAGGARNAIDAALWDLEAKQTGVAAAVIAGINAPVPLNTFLTLGLAPLSRTVKAAKAAVAAGFDFLKIKLDGIDDEARVGAIHEAAPTARLIADANQAWSAVALDERLGKLAALGVEMVEQPLPRRDDTCLAALQLPLPVYADESFETAADLEHAARCYDGVNIKLDKAGGLTAALALADRAAALGLGLMAGNMCGSSLAMAPAFWLAQRCRYVDLDGPLLNAADVEPSIVYAGRRMSLPRRDLWG